MAKEIEVDLSGKTCLVTGATAGIGKEVARGLARLGAHVVLAARSPERGEAARSELLADVPGATLELLRVDLASQRSIRAAAAEVAERFPGLQVLVNNAGVYLPAREETEDGIERTFATNVLGYYLLSELLLDTLRANAPARIVNVASRMAGRLALDDLELRRRRYSAPTAYAQSKQANQMLTLELAERLAGTGVTVNAMHPGPVRTDITRELTGITSVVSWTYFRLLGRTPAQGADTAVWLAASPEVEGITGQFFADRRPRRQRFADPAAIAALRTRCEEMVRASAAQPRGESSAPATPSRG